MYSKYTNTYKWFYFRRAATTKYTRNWQDTKAYNGAASGQQSMKVKRGSMARRSIGGQNKNKSKTDEYSSEFPALDDSKKDDTESPTVVEVSDQNHDKKAVAVAETRQSRQHTTSSRETTKYKTNSPTNRNNRQDQQNGGSSSSTTNDKNYYNRPSTESPISKEKVELNRDSPSSSTNSNYFNRRPQQNSGGHNQYHNYKQQHNSGQGNQGHNQHHQHSLSSAPRGRNFHQHHTSQQYNRDRYFSKGSTSPSSSNSNQHNYDQHRHSVAPTSAGTGRTQHGGGHYQHYNNRQCKYSNIQHVIIMFSESKYSSIIIFNSHLIITIIIMYVKYTHAGIHQSQLPIIICVNLTSSIQISSKLICV